MAAIWHAMVNTTGGQRLMGMAGAEHYESLLIIKSAAYLVVAISIYFVSSRDEMYATSNHI